MIDAEHYDTIADELSDKGYCILPELLPPSFTQQLTQRVSTLETWQQAGVGRSQHFQLNQSIRRDQIYWLDNSHPVDAQFLSIMQNLRSELNQRLFLGLFDYECHYASYSKGQFYKKHLDAFKGKSNRILSTVLYLNPVWQESYHCELKLYSAEGNTLLETVLPHHGCFVSFLSDSFPHEVCPASQQRYSIAGWFRKQGG